MNPPRSRLNRRALLRLRRAAEEPRRDRPAAEHADAGTALLRVSRPAMGSTFEIRLAAHTPGALPLAEQALDLIDELEQQLTVYRDDSEISRLNATAHLAPVEVEPNLFDLLARAVALSAQTNGAYDVTSGALSAAWGFVRGPKRIPDADALADARVRTGWRHLALDHEHRTIAFDRPGVTLNLGSIGKGYALDRAADVIRAHWWPTSALIHGGWSSLYALGSPPGYFGGRWEIALRNPFDPETPLGRLRLRNRGLGTSGTAFQKFEADGRTFGHIIDPRTGAPADGPASVTVLAPTATEADALSTAFYLMGPDAAAPCLAARPDLGAIFVLAPVTGASPRVLTFGLSDADYKRGAS